MIGQILWLNRGMRLRRRDARQDEASERAPLTPEELRARLFQRAVKLLSAKSHSVAELEEKLRRTRGADDATVETVIARLREYGYLDDERLAFGYAANRVRRQPTGRRRLARDLKFKKIDPAVADEALDLVFAETPEEDLIDQAIEKRIRLRGRPKDRIEAKKLFDYLLRQGFQYELTAAKVKAAMIVDSDEAEIDE
jgi:regulatory protein